LLIGSFLGSIEKTSSSFVPATKNGLEIIIKTTNQCNKLNYCLLCLLCSNEILKLVKLQLCYLAISPLSMDVTLSL
jgi:hypothetical protein